MVRGFLVGIGLGPIAAGLAAVATGFFSYMWMTLDTGPANADLQFEAPGLSDSETIRAKLVEYGDTFGSDSVGSPNAREDGFEFAFEKPDDRLQSPSARPSFGERFSLDQPARSSTSFQERY